MKKHFLIQSIKTNIRKADEDGYTQYNITPITAALRSLPKMVDEYNDGSKKTIEFEVYGVSGQDTAVITLRGPRKMINDFPTALLTTNFYDHFSLREEDSPDIYLYRR